VSPPGPTLRPVVVGGTGSGPTGALWIRDLADRTPVGGPLIGHAEEVNALACAIVAGRPTVVSGGDDHTVRVWDLTDPRPVGRELVFPGPVTALALTPQGRMVVGFGGDLAALTLLGVG
jgi:WD40 repeat protein